MSVIDQEYYQEVPSGSVAERLMIAARDRIFGDFVARMRPTDTDTILDVGVSDVINDGANVLERSYAHQQNIKHHSSGRNLCLMTRSDLWLGCNLGCSSPRSTPVHPDTRMASELRRERS